MTQGSSQTL